MSAPLESSVAEARATRRQARIFVIAKSRDKIYNLAFINKLQFYINIPQINYKQ